MDVRLDFLTKFFNRKVAAPAEVMTVVPATPMDRAIQIFDELADMEDLAFGYIQDGCFARAHLMCRRLIERGLMPKKAWAFEGQKKLRINTVSGSVSWWFHVAPVISVELPDKTVQDMVLDPGLFDGPASLQEWGKIMSAPPDKLQIVPFGVAPSGYDGDYCTSTETQPKKDVSARNLLKEHMFFQDKGLRRVFPSRSRQQYLQGRDFPLRGKTWVTLAEYFNPSFPVPPQPEPGLWRKVKALILS